MTNNNKAHAEKDLFWKETGPDVARTYFILALVAVGIFMVFAIEDWFSHQSEIVPLYIAKAFVMVVLLGTAFMTRTRWGKMNGEILGLIGFFATFFVGVYHSYILQWIFMVSLVAIFCSFASASFMPWRPRYHIWVVFGSIASLIASIFVVGDTASWPPDHLVVAGSVFSLASIIIAYYTQQRRFALWKAERALNDQHQFLQIVLDSLTHPFYVINAQDYTVEMANTAANAEGRLGEIPCYHLIHGSDDVCDSDQCPCPLDEVRRSKQPVCVEHVRSDVTGQKNHYEVHGFPILDQDGEVIQMIEYALDINERVQAESQRQRLAATEERERIGRELHDDLGQVMSYIHMQTEAARARLKLGDSAATDQILEEVNQAAQEGHDSVRQHILGIRSQKTQPQHSDFLSAIESYLDVVRGRYNLEIELIAATNLRQTLQLEPTVETQALRVIQEGITNIYKHASANLVQVNMALDGDWLQIIIQDDGRGFSSDQEVEGHYGLQIMQERVESVNGQLEISSEPDVGTQVQVWVPRLLTTRSGEERSYPWRVLLADDHTLFLEGLGNMLRPYGIQVVGVANDGVEAEEMAADLKPDLILMDIHMPERDGLEATRIIKEQFPEIKIVMLTMAADDKLLMEALRNGASGYLLKSLPAPQFMSLLTDVMGGKVVVSPNLATQVLTALAQGDQQLTPATDSDDELTERQHEVLRCIAEGMNNKQIAGELYISESTVKYHIGQIMERLGLQTRHELIRYQIESDN